MRGNAEKFYLSRMNKTSNAAKLVMEVA